MCSVAWSCLSATSQIVVVCAVDDEFALKAAIDRYEDIDNSFGGSREHKLLLVSLPPRDHHTNWCEVCSSSDKNPCGQA